MPCKACQSRTQNPFRSEINIHLHAEIRPAMPSVLIFPELLVCLDCGFAEFSIPPADLSRLANGLRESTGEQKAA